MQEVVAKEGPRAPLFCLAATLLLLSAKFSVAQSVDLSSLEDCANLERPELKLACFEAIIAGARTVDEPVSEAAVAVTSENKPAVLEAEIAIANEPVSAPAAIEAEIAVASEPVSAPAAIDAGIAVAAMPGKPPAASEPTIGEASMSASPPVAAEGVPDMAKSQVEAAVSATPSVEEFGREQLAELDQEEKNEVLSATVIDVTQGYNKALYFHLANGHIWRQIEPRRLQYPKNEDFDVNITQGVMGDYRLRIGDKGRMVRIRRVQ